MLKKRILAGVLALSLISSNVVFASDADIAVPNENGTAILNQTNNLSDQTEAVGEETVDGVESQDDSVKTGETETSENVEKKEEDVKGTEEGKPNTDVGNKDTSEVTDDGDLKDDGTSETTDENKPNDGEEVPETSEQLPSTDTDKDSVPMEDLTPAVEDKSYLYKHLEEVLTDTSLDYLKVIERLFKEGKFFEVFYNDSKALEESKVTEKKYKVDDFVNRLDMSGLYSYIKFYQVELVNYISNDKVLKMEFDEKEKKATIEYAVNDIATLTKKLNLMYKTAKEEGSISDEVADTKKVEAEAKLFEKVYKESFKEVKYQDKEVNNLNTIVAWMGEKSQIDTLKLYEVICFGNVEDAEVDRLSGESLKYIYSVYGFVEEEEDNNGDVENLGDNSDGVEDVTKPEEIIPPNENIDKTEDTNNTEKEDKKEEIQYVDVIEEIPFSDYGLHKSMGVKPEDKDSIDFKEKVTAILKDGTSEKIEINWVLRGETSKYWKDAKNGSFKFYIQLPEGYEWSEEVLNAFKAKTVDEPYFEVYMMSEVSPLGSMGGSRWGVVDRVNIERFYNTDKIEVMAHVTENVDEVLAPTWSDDGGQDDIKWHVLGKGSWTRGGQWYNYASQIPVSNHIDGSGRKEYGRYNTHIYAKRGGRDVGGFAANEYYYGSTRIEGTNRYIYCKDLYHALSNVISGDTVKVIQNTEFDFGNNRPIDVFSKNITITSLDGTKKTIYFKGISRLVFKGGTVNISNIIFDGSSSSSDGNCGLICSNRNGSSRAQVNFNNCNFQNYGYNKSGFIWTIHAESGGVDVNNCNFTNLNKGVGAVSVMSSSGQEVVRNSTFTNISSTSIHVQSSVSPMTQKVSNVTMNNVKEAISNGVVGPHSFRSEVSDVRANGVYGFGYLVNSCGSTNRDNSTVYMNRVTFTAKGSGMATGGDNGYGVVCRSSNVTIDNSNISNFPYGMVTRRGSGGKGSNYSKITTNNTNVYNCKTHAVLKSSEGIGEIVLNGGSFYGNSGQFGGGASYAQGSAGSITLNSVIARNNTSTSKGGAIVTEGAPLNINGCQIYENRANDNSGGGIYVYGGTTTIRDSIIRNNTSSWTGGGLTAVGSSTVNITNTNIRNNTSPNGGGIYMAGDAKVNITKTGTNMGNIESNTASTNGGGIFMDGGTLNTNGVLINSNTTNGNGGGVFVNWKAVKHTSTNDTIANNKATNGGGVALWAGNGSYNGTKFTGNSASKYGGGLNSGKPVTLTNVTVDSNTAGSHGGGLFVESTTTLNNGSVTNNKATGENGGGVYLNYGTLNINGTTISGNVGNKGAGGIGTYAQEGEPSAVVNFNSGTITNNSTNNGYGGGVALWDNTIFNSKGNITNNKANGRSGGGAIHIGARSSVVMSSGNMTGNYAKNSGGAIYLEGKSFDMNGGTITGNKTDGSSGGVGIFGGTFNHNGGSVYSNGGGSNIYVAGGTYNLKGGKADKVYLAKNNVINWWGQDARINNNAVRVDMAEYINGTDVVVRKDGKLGSDAHKGIVYFVSGNSTHPFRGGDLNMKTNTNLVVSQAYPMNYSKGDNDYKVSRMPSNESKFWNETYIIKPEDGKSVPVNETHTFMRFRGWDTSGDGVYDSESAPNKALGRSVNKATTFTADWGDIVTVIYNGNGSTSGSRKVVYNIKGDSYTIRDNKGFTNFARTGHTFAGFSFIPTTSSKNAEFNDGVTDTVSINELREHAVENKGMLEVNIYAIWDKAPEITFDGINEFYEGTDVDVADLKKGVKVTDEDTDIQSKLKITEIKYSSGKLVNGAKQPAYSKKYTNGMGTNDRLDTWFMALDKKDSPVTHKLVFTVTDSFGNTTVAENDVKVKYNNAPEMVARDRYFTIEEANSGKITESFILNDSKSKGYLKVSDVEENSAVQDRVDIVNFNPDEFKGITNDTTVELELKVTDTMGPNGVGKETTGKFTIIISDDGNTPDISDKVTYNVRFIDEENYNKNVGKYDDNLSDSQKSELNGNGGLNVDSKWYSDSEYRSYIEGSFNSGVDNTYTMTPDDIEAAKGYLDSNGIGNTKSDNGLSGFANQFMN